MCRIRLDVCEVHARSVGVCVCVCVQQDDLDEYLVLPLEGERLECCLIRNGHGAVAERDGGGGVHWVTRRVVEFGDVVNAIAVDVGWLGDEVSLRPVALGGQRRHVLGQRGRARRSLLYQHRDLDFRAVHIVLHIQHEVVVGRGRDHDRHGGDRHRRRCRGETAARARVEIALGVGRPRHDRQQAEEGRHPDQERAPPGVRLDRATWCRCRRRNNES